MTAARMFAVPAAHALTPVPVVRDGPTHAGPVTVVRIPDGLDAARTPVVPAAIVPIPVALTDAAPTPVAPAETVRIRAGLTVVAPTSVDPALTDLAAGMTGGNGVTATIVATAGAGSGRNGATISIATNAVTRPSVAGSAT